MFRKAVSYLMILTLLLSALTVCVNASRGSIESNGTVSVIKSEPTMDGEPKPSDCWSSPAIMEDRTLGYILNDTEAGFYAEVYFAANEKGFYFSANILENVVSYDPDMSFGDTAENKNMFVFSTDVDNGDTAAAGWNGDTFIITLDPLGAMIEKGFTGEADHAPQYAVSLFEDGGVRMYREMVNEGEITDLVTLAGKRTEFGWCFEACIPWRIIIQDLYDITFGEVILEKWEILSKESIIRASVAYCDRYITADGRIADLNHYVTSAVGARPGLNVAAMGLELIIRNICTPLGHDWVFDLYFDSTYVSEGFGINKCSVCGAIEYVTIPKKVAIDAFDDVKESYWYAEAVSYCLSRSYMVGVAEGRFAPAEKLTREQFVMILANYEGVDTDEYINVDSGMKDVPRGRWYSGAVAWAVEEGYVSGVAPGRFGTGQSIERAALVRLLWLYTQKQGIDVSRRADLSVYSDAHRIQDWMRDGLEWAVYNGIITSTSDYYMTLDPKGTVSRAMAAVMVMNYDRYMYDAGFEKPKSEFSNQH